MKRIISCILAVVLCVCCLSSCVGSMRENEWFSDEKLSECLVSDLPKIDKSFISQSDNDIYVNFTDEEYEIYLDKVYKYLKARDFRYLGTRGAKKDTLAGALTTYFFEPADYLSRFDQNGRYIFVFSDDSADEGEVTFSILTLYKSEDKNLEYDNKDFSYNTLISLRRGSEAPLGGMYVLPGEGDHKHIFGEWHYDEAYHWCSADCTWDMCDIDTAAEHYDENEDGNCDVCGYSMEK